jgi:hypothetical protein
MLSLAAVLDCLGKEGVNVLLPVPNGATYLDMRRADTLVPPLPHGLYRYTYLLCHFLF